MARSAKSLVMMLALGAPLLSGCAEALLTSGLPASGWQADGRYLLTAHELTLDCPHLRSEIQGSVERIQAMPSRLESERASLPPTLFSTIGRLVGSGADGFATIRDYDRERARLDALGARLVARDCGSLDVSRDLEATAAKIEQARKG